MAERSDAVQIVWTALLRLRTIEQTGLESMSRRKRRKDFLSLLIKAAAKSDIWSESGCYDSEAMYDGIVADPQDRQALSELADLVNIDPDGLNLLIFATLGDKRADASFFAEMLRFVISEFERLPEQRISEDSIASQKGQIEAELRYYLNLPDVPEIAVQGICGHAYDIVIRSDGIVSLTLSRRSRQIGHMVSEVLIGFAGLDCDRKRRLAVTPDTAALVVSFPNRKKTSCSFHRYSDDDGRPKYPLAFKLSKKDAFRLTAWMSDHME